jgi:acetylornithine deacetylase/succinyl-diaminopimelate desuccinylase-like protein
VVEIDPIVLDTYIADRAEVAFDFLERLVAIPSTLGREQEALWAEIAVRARPAPGPASGQTVNPVERALGVVAALRELERELNESVDDPVLAGVPHPYTLNLGTFRAGNWPSSVPSVARLGVRFGFSRQWTAARAEARLREVVASAARSDPWLAEHPPEMRCAVELASIVDGARVLARLLAAWPLGGFDGRR